MQQPKFYTKKPVTIQAIEWTGGNLLQVQSFIENGDVDLSSDNARRYWEDYIDIVKEKGLHIHTLEGAMRADIGDYIIKGIKGEFYPCKPDIFKATYDEAES